MRLTIILLAVAILSVMRTFSPAHAAESSIAREIEAELQLALSIELSTEPGNKGALVGRLQRNHLLRTDDLVDVTQRVSELRKELIARYAAPFEAAGFREISHELRFGDYKQFVTAEKRLATQQAAYRNLYGRAFFAGKLALGWGMESLRIESAATLAPYLANFVAHEGTSSQTVPLIAAWTRDRRHAFNTLPSGHFDHWIAEWGLPVGDIPYLRMEATHESYWRPHSRFAGGFTATAGILKPFGGHLSPIGKRFYGGGPGTVRGYESAALGPLDSSGANMGAERKTTVAVEALWHAFDIGQTPLIVSLFADRGRFSQGVGSAINGASADAVGIGISVPIPFGIARFYFADPRQSQYRQQRFQFEARANWR